ncbi:MAG TPA: hypothetical protein VKJ01_07985 [Candidatus Solibacter sp.]|nr:hypothetical protein [Candidatus Solibacter sp.]
MRGLPFGIRIDSLPLRTTHSRGLPGPAGRGGALDGVLEIAALYLELVRPEVHAFRPDYAREQLHRAVTRTAANAGIAEESLPVARN